MVDGAGDEILAGPTLAEEQHRRSGDFGHPSDEASHFLDLGMLAQDCPDGEFAGARFLQRTGLFP